MTAEAERRGLASAWLSEHHLFEDGYLPQPLTFAAALAARTRTMRIGTAVLLAPLRSAISMAEEAAIVDVVSGGRLELGLGAGYRVPEYEAFGVEGRARFELLETRAREIRELWAEGRVTPRPLQSPVPFWVGAHGPRSARLAGRLGAGLLSLKPALWEPYREALEAAGHPPEGARAGGPLGLFLADDPERAWAVIEPHVRYHWQTYDFYAHEGREGPSRPPDLPDVFTTRAGTDRLPMRVVTVEQAAAQIRKLGETMNVDHVFFWERAGGFPDEIAHRHVELLAEGLVPALERVGE